MLYFLLHDADALQRSISPRLAESWQRRSFAPIAELAADLAPALDAFAERFHLTAGEEPLLRQVAAGQPFDRRLWRHLAGEVLLYAAADAPVLQTTPDTLTCLLAPERLADAATPRELSAPIRQAHFGSRDTQFGGAVYRSDHAGFNNTADVARLAAYLAGVDSSAWTAADLSALPLADDEEREEELAFARDAIVALHTVYEQARERGQVIVCEVI